MIEAYCVVLLMFTAIAGILEGEVCVALSPRTCVRVLGMSGKRHQAKERKLLAILESIGA